MTDCMKNTLSIAEKFALLGEIVSIEPYGNGHINSTFLLVTDKKRYIFQKMNTTIFKDSEALMRNICLVTEHLRAKGIETLEVIPTKDGKSFYHGEEGAYRVYAFIEHTVAYDKVDDAAIFMASGKAFGEFQKELADFDASLLADIIANFHNTPVRFENFKRALAADALGRAKDCKEEIDFVLSRADKYSIITDAMAKGEVPLRVTHNDTKLNNILMDSESGNARAIIDLDTVMPGSMLYDFGDSIRFGASTGAEDEKDLSLVNFDISLFEAYVKGYCGAVKESITEGEADLMPWGAFMMTIECGMRFLTDYLEGDTYFATKYEEHNLVRCRTQFKLASQMQERIDEMREIVLKVVK